jgi:hypothetical protein
LNSAKNTHLIADSFQGPKCEAAADCETTIHIVQSAWLDACAKQMRWVDEKPFSLLPVHAEEPIRPALMDAIQERLSENDPLLQIKNCIFSGCQFCLLGFSSDEVIELGRLIRRGLGTIHWQLQEGVSHVIFKDHQVDAEAMRYVKLVRTRFVVAS